MINLHLRFLVVLGFLSIAQFALAQDCVYNPSEGRFEGAGCPNAVQTAVPFLQIIQDARTGGMGDIGNAISPDANSIFYNASKLAFAENKGDIAINYTPWLRDLVRDIYLVSIAGYLKLDDLQAVTGSIRYFNMGEIQFTNENGEPQGMGNPNEFDVSLGYARKLGEKLSLGVTGRFIYSDLAANQTVSNIDIKAGTAGAVDLTLFYTAPVAPTSDLNVGLAITNIGSKITYTETQNNPGDFLPTNLSLGASYQMQLDAFNKLALNAEFNKLLVPTPQDPTDPASDADNNGILDYREESPIAGIFSSFGDAPAGGSEELKEVTWALGAEYLYNDVFALRAGYFHEAEAKGNRQHFTLGVGIKYQVFGIDLAYLINANGRQNPLNNTIRFTLRFKFDALAAETVE